METRRNPAAWNGRPQQGGLEATRKLSGPMYRGSVTSGTLEERAVGCNFMWGFDGIEAGGMFGYKTLYLTCAFKRIQAKQEGRLLEVTASCAPQESCVFWFPGIFCSIAHFVWYSPRCWAGCIRPGAGALLRARTCVTPLKGLSLSPSHGAVLPRLLLSCTYSTLLYDILHAFFYTSLQAIKSSAIQAETEIFYGLNFKGVLLGTQLAHTMCRR